MHVYAQTQRWQQHQIGISAGQQHTALRERAPQGSPVDTALTWITVDPRQR